MSDLKNEIIKKIGVLSKFTPVLPSAPPPSCGG
jgi:hypothetical protein